MEVVGILLGGLGALGILGAVLVGCLIALVLPWWAIVDCVLAPRSNGAKAARQERGAAELADALASRTTLSRTRRLGEDPIGRGTSARRHRM